MNMEQIEKRNKSIIENGIEWANGRECEPLDQLDVAILAEVVKMDLPKAFYKFEFSRSRHTIRTYGAEKTIFKTLDKLANRILKMEA